MRRSRWRKRGGCGSHTRHWWFCRSLACPWSLEASSEFCKPAVGVSHFITVSERCLLCCRSVPYVLISYSQPHTKIKTLLGKILIADNYIGTGLTSRFLALEYVLGATMEWLAWATFFSWHIVHRTHSDWFCKDVLWCCPLSSLRATIQSEALQRNMIWLPSRMLTGEGLLEDKPSIQIVFWTRFCYTCNCLPVDTTTVYLNIVGHIPYRNANLFNINTTQIHRES